MYPELYWRCREGIKSEFIYMHSLFSSACLFVCYCAIAWLIWIVMLYFGLQHKPAAWTRECMKLSMIFTGEMIEHGSR